MDGDDPKEKFKELLGSVKVETVVVRAPDPPAVADFPKVIAVDGDGTEAADEFAVVIDGSTAAATVVVGVDDDAWKLNFDAIDADSVATVVDDNDTSVVLVVESDFGNQKY